MKVFKKSRERKRISLWAGAPLAFRASFLPENHFWGKINLVHSYSLLIQKESSPNSLIFSKSALVILASLLFLAFPLPQQTTPQILHCFLNLEYSSSKYPTADLFSFSSAWSKIVPSIRLPDLPIQMTTFYQLFWCPLFILLLYSIHHILSYYLFIMFTGHFLVLTLLLHHQ